MTTNDLNRRAFLTGVSAAACAAALPWPASKIAAIAPHFPTVILPQWLHELASVELKVMGSISGIHGESLGSDIFCGGIRYIKQQPIPTDA